ncbi:hypothetical protein [Spirochaeta cellobiosiphila]|uniref:hypothetical protein n=1 Tax=Spirochaeta cellobiosiphila TaxID=504483 RepID=UPI000417243F|nr:hypothetical protein [Spirochaeta cellobiosiphila]
MEGQEDGLSFFNKDAVVTLGGVHYKFDEDDFKSILKTTAGWHSKNDPSSDLVASLVAIGKSKFETHLDRDTIIRLCAQTLNITIEQIEHALDWQAGYMSWHEGAPEGYYHVWPKES